MKERYSSVPTHRRLRTPVQNARWRMPTVSILLAKWKWLIVGCLAVYCVVLYWPLSGYIRKEKYVGGSIIPRFIRPSNEETWTTKASHSRPADLETSSSEQTSNTNKSREEPKAYKFAPRGRPAFFVEEVLSNSGISLAERLECHADRTAPPKVILSWNAGHTQDNLGGCPEWNCKLTSDRKEMNNADAVLMARQDPTFKRRSDQYIVFFSQESPVNYRFEVPFPDYFNMSLGFRHDTPTSSPYGYTVRLAPSSRPQGELVNMARVNGKTKGAAWFVSHCGTNSKREVYVQDLTKFFPVDIYGRCGRLNCARGGKCENMLDWDYHFYVAFENSICKDYITEKLWNQGYQRDIVPLVLKRSLVEPFVPPNSFIAADDFNTTEDLATYLHYLMKNKTAYAEYFTWRREYKVVFLNGKYHDALERPWGFCQLCRLLWEKPRPTFSISDFKAWWDQSCEPDGALVDRLVQPELATPRNNSSRKRLAKS
ncbi:hypothetical protein V3C99_010696 [Haemonchus contortus]